LRAISARFSQPPARMSRSVGAGLVSDVADRINALAKRGVVQQVAHRATQVSGHGFHQVIGFPVNGARIQRVVPVADPQKTGCLLEGFGPRRGPSSSPSREAVGPFSSRWTTMFLASAAKPGNVCEKLGARRIHRNAHGVHTAHHHIVQAFFQFPLIHIVLVLSDPDGLGIDLTRFRPWSIRRLRWRWPPDGHVAIGIPRGLERTQSKRTLRFHPP